MIVLPVSTSDIQKDEWFNSPEDGYDLKKIASKIKSEYKTGNARIDHAIPSPAAYLINFRHKLNNIIKGEEISNIDEQIFVDWKAILAVIALSDNYGLDIKMDLISLANSYLGEVIKEELVTYCDWPEAVVNLPVFILEKGGKRVPFAFAAPKISICPFKTYPIEFFDNLEWFDKDNRCWKDPLEVLFSNKKTIVQGKKLYYWYKSLEEWYKSLEEQNKEGNNYSKLYSLYGNLIEKNNIKLTKVDEKNYGPMVDKNFSSNWSNNTTNKNLNLSPFRKIPAAPENILPASDVFSDKILIFIPYNLNYDMAFKDLENANIFKDLQPNGANLKAYLTPPVSTKLVTLINDNKEISIDNISYQNDDFSFFHNDNQNLQELKVTSSITLHFEKENQYVRYEKKYDINDIVWTDSFPYILLWPNVDLPVDRWCSYYLAVSTHTHGRESNKSSAMSNTVFGNEKFIELNKIDSDEFDIIAISDGNIDKKGFAVRSYYNPVAPKKESVDFKYFHAKRIFKAIGFSNKPLSEPEGAELGCLWINHSKGETYNKTSPRFIKDKEYVVGIDFGTTSTNVYTNISSGHPESIESPGKYVLELTKTDKKQDKIDQDSYFFSSNKNELNKIFTAGQLFHAKEGQGTNPISNEDFISGKYVVIDQDDFWLQGSNVSLDFAKSDIYFRLKFPDEVAGQEENTIAAAYLFIQTLLQTALLECIINGADKIAICYSYPFETEHRTNIWETVIEKSFEKINPQASNDIQYRHRAMTESEAAAQYFIHFNSNATKPHGEQGYAILDIGGGTSDFSIWKNNDNKSNDKDEVDNMLRGQHSFKYAGQMLVNHSIIQTIAKDTLRNKLMLADKKLEVVFDKYAFITYGDAITKGLEKPLGINPDGPINPNLSTAISLLDIILEHNCLQKDVYNIKEFRVCIKIKYMALFYLLAKYISYIEKLSYNSSIFDNSTGLFTIHLAGCGAKGLNYCIEGGSLENFSESQFGKAVIIMMESIIGLSSPNAIKIYAPVSKSKEEVVKGLVMKTFKVHETSTNIPDKETKIKKESFNINLQKTEDEYKEFIKTLKEYIKYDQDVVETLCVFEWKQPYMQERFKGLFESTKKRLVKSNPCNGVAETYFCLLMVDELINLFYGNPKKFLKG